MTLNRLQESWDEWGRRDPLWVILSDPEKRDGQWNVDEFFATGPREVRALFDKIAQLGVAVGRGRALDFGCGVGRITQALCEYFDECIGIDIAPSMIEGAERYNRYPEKCHYLVNAKNDLSQFPSDHFDLIYCKLVLQHMDPGFSREYIAEFARALSPLGLLVFQVPSELVSSGKRSSGTSTTSWHERVRSALGRRRRVVDSKQTSIESDQSPNVVMQGIRCSEVLRVLEGSEGRLITVEEDGLAGAAWLSYTYYVTKDLAPS
jgi:SAM-dependent methyltransferase